MGKISDDLNTKGWPLSRKGFAYKFSRELGGHTDNIPALNSLQ